MFTKFEYFKKRAEILASQCEDIQEKYQTENNMKIHLLNKVRELEGQYVSSTAEVIQHRKDAFVIYKDNIDF